MALLQRKEIRLRALAFVREWRGETRELNMLKLRAFGVTSSMSLG